jgi:hypothetical protein
MMGLAGLIGFITVMWIMILAVAAFLIVFVAPIDVILFRGSLDRLVTSIIQAFIAITVVIILVLGLNRMKTIYMRRKLQL